jgi:hypothetical protein
VPSDSTRYGDSAAAKSLLAIVYEQPKAKALNSKVSACLSLYSYTASKLEEISDPHVVGALQKMLMHETSRRALETFGNGVLGTHLCNVIKIRYRQFERRARISVKEANNRKKLDSCSVCKGAKGGVRGNENIIDGVIKCDYCHAEGSS